jgi:hypothetical protein
MHSCTGKGKFTVLEAVKAQRGEGIKLYSFLNLGAKWGWVITVTHRPLYPPGKRHGTPFTRSRMGPRMVWTGAENLTPTRI